MASPTRGRVSATPPLLLLCAALLLLVAGAQAKHKAHESEAALHGQTPVMPNPLLTTAPQKVGWMKLLVSKISKWGPSAAPSEAAYVAKKQTLATAVPIPVASIPERVGQGVEAAKAKVAGAVEGASSSAAGVGAAAQAQAQGMVDAAKARAADVAQGASDTYEGAKKAAIGHPAAAHAQLAAEHADSAREEAASSAHKAASGAAQRLKDATARLVGKGGGHGAPAAPGEL